MALESPVTYISDLNSANPTVSDPRNEGDDHIRNVKSAVKATFPNITGAVTATQAELNILDGVTASTAELNILDGVTATTAELNYVDGVTSAIQTQLDAKAALASPTFTGTLTCAALTATGNVTLGDAGTDTVTTNGNVTINASTAGTPFTVNCGGAFGIDITSSAGNNGNLRISADGATPGTGSFDLGQGYSAPTDDIAWLFNRANAAMNFGTNNTLRYSIDASGRWINPGNTQPKFRANRTTNQTSGSTIVFDDESTAANKNCDHGSNYNASTGIFTAPVAGYYVFEFSGVFANSTGSSYVQYCTIVADSVNIGQSSHVDIPNGQSRGVSVSAGAYLDANDQVSILSNNTFTASNYLLAGTNAAFSGRLVC